MKLSLPAASLLALALFAVPAMSQDQPAAGAATAAEQPGVLAEAAALLADKRPLSELSIPELTQRIRTARNLIDAGGLDADTAAKLEELIKTARAERLARQQQATQAPAAEQGTQPAESQPPIATQIPDDVLAFIKDERPLDQMSRKELRARMMQARQFIQANKGKPEIRKPLRAIVQSLRAELARRNGQATPPAGDSGSAAPPQPGSGSAGEPGENAPPVAEQSPPPDAGDAAALDSNAANPADEAKAREFLADPRRAEQLSDAELRARLNGIRALMAGNRLSPQTERQLRRKLAAERIVLRARIAARQGGGAGQSAGNAGGALTGLDAVLADRRPSGRLAVPELRRRIRVYRDAAFDPRYAESDRLRWRETIVEDRRALRLRLIEARRARAEELAARRGAGELDIDIDIAMQPGEPRDVDAAEVDDAEIEDFLVARPRRKLERRYTIGELEDSGTLRDVMPRIEIDTIHFGFGEAFVREEEVENFDRIAEIMERILAVHPREIFVIEGHTDAVGSYAFNLRLSRQRARAVMQALTTYYVIPGENLRTVGYGERFLKIPTSEPEGENRRVSIARATALIGEADE